MSFDYEAAKNAASNVANTLHQQGVYKDDAHLTSLLLGNLDAVPNLTAEAYAQRATALMKQKYEITVPPQEVLTFENTVRDAIVASQSERQ